VVKRIPLPSTRTQTDKNTHTHILSTSILSHFRGAKYSSNLVTLPSVRWGLFIRGVSRLSFIVNALSFLPFSFISFSFFPLRMFLLCLHLLSLDIITSSFLSPRDTNYIPALTYSGLMPVVLPSPNLLFEHHLPTPPISFCSCLSYIFSFFIFPFSLFSSARCFAGAV